MPKVTKQGVNGLTTQARSVLERIAPVSEGITGIKLCVYGRGKTGKTRLACTFPKPLLLIGTEDGTKSVANVPDVDFVRIDLSADLSILTEALAEGKYQTAVLDTAGGFQDIVLKEVLGLDDVPVSKFRQASKGEAWGIADKGTWGTVGTRCKELLRPFLRLAETVGIDVVAIAHERSFGDDDKSDVMIAHIGPALIPSLAGWLNGECDYVSNTYTSSREVVRNVTVGTGKSQITTQVREKMKGVVDYCLRVGPSDTYMTGFRLPDGVKLPEYIVDPHYDKIVALIEGTAVG